MIPKCSNLIIIGLRNDLEISCKGYDFGLKGQRSRLGLELGLGLTLMSDPMFKLGTGNDLRKSYK